MFFHFHRWFYFADRNSTVWRVCFKCLRMHWWMSVVQAWSGGCEIPQEEILKSLEHLLQVPRPEA